MKGPLTWHGQKRTVRCEYPWPRSKNPRTGAECDHQGDPPVPLRFRILHLFDGIMPTMERGDGARP